MKTIEITSCDGCPFAHFDADYGDKTTCNHPNHEDDCGHQPVSESSVQGTPPPPECPLRSGATLVQFVDKDPGYVVPRFKKDITPLLEEGD